MNKVLVLTIITTAFAVSGCATMFNGKTQKVHVTTSNGKSSDITINGLPYKAPGIIEIPRKGEDAIVDATGECKGQVLAVKSLDWVFWLNGLVPYFGSFSSTTDYVNNSMWHYQSNIEIKCS